MKKWTLVVLMVFANFTINAYDSKKSDIIKQSVTVYNDFMVVNELRKLNLDKYDYTINVHDISQSIDWDSLQISGKKLIEIKKNDLNFSKKNILRKYIGKEIEIYDKNENKKTYKLLSIENELVVKSLKTKEIIISPKGTVVLPNQTNTMQNDEVLTLKVDPHDDGKEIELTYMAKGLSWKNEYVVNLLDDDKLEFIAWLSLKNNSDMNLDRVDANFVDKNFENKKIQHIENIDSNQVSERLKNLTILKGEDKKIPLIQIEDFSYEKSYFFENGFDKVREVAIIENIKKIPFGKTLAKGIIHIYNKSNEENKELVAYTKFPKVLVGEKIIIPIKNSDKVKAELNNVSAKSITANITEYEKEFIVRNHQSKKVKIDLIYNFEGDWEILSHSDKYKKESSTKIIFTTNVLGNSTKKVKFKYKLIK